MSAQTPVISSREARRMFLGLQGLLNDPSVPIKLPELIERLGFVQIDTINVVERAHHLILGSRIDQYDPRALDALLTKQRKIFEHWTHDASLIPTKWFSQWKHRFERYRTMKWHAKQMGKDADVVSSGVLERIRADGPLMSKDFEHARAQGDAANDNKWWGWKPHKVALDYLWRTGELYVVARKNFQKVYDLTERAVPRLFALPTPSAEAHLDWACRTALERLGFASSKEIADFWNAVKVDRVKVWLVDALESGEVVEVSVESADGSSPRPAFAFADFRKRLGKLSEEAPNRTRLMCPFDPVLRDRARALRRFNFDYRFEGFVPKKLRTHGYYVMPVMEGNRFIARVDPKFHRDRGLLEIRWQQWEPDVRVTKARRSAFESAVERLAGQIGATRVKFPKVTSSNVRSSD